MSDKKILLMGRSGSGKSSMRSIIFANKVASDTRTLVATRDVETTKVRFMGSLKLDVWDCAGQDNYFDDFLANRQDALFRSVHSLIYIFDVESPKFSTTDLDYFGHCLAALRSCSGRPVTPGISQAPTPLSPSNLENGHDQQQQQQQGPFVRVLIHKMDLVPPEEYDAVLESKSQEIKKRCQDAGWDRVQIYGTSIWNESLYKAWSQIVSSFIPNSVALQSHLESFAGIASAAEVVLLESTTFLVISRYTDQSTSRRLSWEEDRFEKICQCVKLFRRSCSQILKRNFGSMEIKHRNYTAVLAALTPNAYLMVVSVDPGVQPAGILLNIQLSSEKFAKLQTATLLG